MKKNTLFCSVLCLLGLSINTNAQNVVSETRAKQTNALTDVTAKTSSNETAGNSDAISCVKRKKDRNAFAGNNKVVNVDQYAGTIDLFETDPTRDPGGRWARIAGTGGIVNFGDGTFNPIGASSKSVFRYVVVAQNSTVDKTDVTIYVGGKYAKGSSTGATEMLTDAAEQGAQMATEVMNETTNGGANAIFCEKKKKPGVAFAGNNKSLRVNPGAGAIDLFAADPTRDPGGIWSYVSHKNGSFNYATGKFDPLGFTSKSVFRYTVVDENGKIDKADVTVHAEYKYKKGDASGSEVVALSEGNMHELKVFPNPAINRIMFKGISESSADISIYSTDGRLAAAYQQHDMSQGLDVSGLPSGTYQLKATSGDDSYVARFVVVH